MTDYTEARALAERACGLLSIGQDTTNSAMEQVSRALLSALGELERVRKERDASLYGRNADRDAALDARDAALRERDALAEALRDAHSELQFCARSFSEMGGSGPAHAKRIRRLLPCAECGGAGALDSGGVDPAGNSVDVACPICGRAVGGY